MENDVRLTEKQKIEKATAEKFLFLYNKKEKTFFNITRLSDSPDVECMDSKGKILNLEITIHASDSDVLQDALGRGFNHQQNYKAYPAHSLPEIEDKLWEQIKVDKLSKRYGSNVALVIRYHPPMNYSWQKMDFLSKVKNIQNPFDMGIWVLDGNVICRID